MALMALCLYSLSAQAADWAWSGLIFDTKNTLSKIYESYQKKDVVDDKAATDDTSNGSIADDEEEIEAIYFGSDDDSSQDDSDLNNEGEIVEFSYEKLVEDYPEIKLLPADHNVFLLDSEGLCAKLNDYFKIKEQAGINLFISLERYKQDVALDILDSLDIDPELRLAIFLDAPARYVAKLFSDLRNHFSSKDSEEGENKKVLHWGSFVFSDPFYGTIEANEAFVSGELVASQYFGVLWSQGVSGENDFNLRLKRLFDILSEMDDQGMYDLFIYEPDQCLIHMNHNDRDICYGSLKEKGLCTKATTAGLPPMFVAMVLSNSMIISDNAAIKILQHEKAHYPDRCKAIIENMDGSALKALIRKLPGDYINFINKIRPEIISGGKRGTPGDFLEIASGSSQEEILDDLLRDLI